MSVFNGIYKYFGGYQPVTSGSEVAIAQQSGDKCSAFTRTLKRFTWLVLAVPHSAYNAALMAIHKEFQEPIRRNLCVGNPITSLPFFGTSYHVITSPKIFEVIGKHFRHDPQNGGPFQDKMNRIVFLDLVKDLLRNEQVSTEDFIFTASRENIHKFRRPFLKFVAANRGNAPLLDEVIVHSFKYLDTLENDGVVSVDALKLSEGFAVAVISRIFFGQIPSFDECIQIGEALTQANNYQLVKAWSKPNRDDDRKYMRSLDVLGKALDSARGDFVDFLNEQGMTNAEIKSTLLLAFLGGAETPSSLLHYMLWQIGQHKEHQAEPQIQNILKESLRLYSSAYLVARFVAEPLLIKVENEDGSKWQYPIAKGEGILYSPVLAGRDPLVYFDGDQFNPDRFKGKEKEKSLDWNPFGSGVHKCPGEALALNMVPAFFSALLNRYDIASSPNKKELKFTARITMKAEDVMLTMARKLDSFAETKKDL